MMQQIPVKSKKKYGLIALLLLLLISIGACFYPSVHPEATEPMDTGSVAWMLTATALVLFMTPGLSFFYGGMVKAKNIISTMLQSFIAMGIVSIIWYVFGFSLAFGDSIGGIIGDPRTFFMFNNIGTAPHPTIGSGLPLVIFAMFQLKFAIITPALVTGSFAERVRFWAYLLFICLFTVAIYCPLAHWIWHPDGFLAKLGALDFAGGAVIHISAGIAGLVGAIVLGRRKSHINGEEHTTLNIPYVLLGTGLLWFGWFGFNAGSALAANSQALTAFINTNMASAAAMLAWILLDAARGRKATALGACIGAVVGLATVTPAAGYIAFGPSILIGAFAAIVSNMVVHWKSKSTLDDTLDVFPCHGLGGIIGMLATGIFAVKGGLITGSFNLFFTQIIVILVVAGFSFFGSFIIYKIINFIIPLRVREEEEELGLDLSQHRESVFNNHSQVALMEKDLQTIHN
jgi:Amt family ammonium transporter